ncbi:hypothetical protein [Methanobacterium sp. MBAC-LM]|uniref:hypothetical protein n=1 Tax=Methanobacterium sp. MBAC-LM TaxID=3412034 RepID=UPI003C741590
MIKKMFIILILMVGIIAAAAFMLYNSSDHSTLGSNSKGYVTKDVYAHYSASAPKIAVITGMHPRETSAKTVVPEVIKLYALTHNVEIVNYKVTVTDSPQDFTTGRYNGQCLVAKYIIPDIAKSNYSLVIIVHDHEKGYGSGYYIATPTMDSPSVNLAEKVSSLLPDFNYYQRNTDSKAQSSSINQVDTPIVNTGTPVFVYEIPEWLSNYSVFTNSNRLIDACFNSI